MSYLYSLLVTFVSLQKTAEPIEMPFWDWLTGPKEHVEIPHGKGKFLGLSGHGKAWVTNASYAAKKINATAAADGSVAAGSKAPDWLISHYNVPEKHSPFPLWCGLSSKVFDHLLTVSFDTITASHTVLASLHHAVRRRMEEALYKQVWWTFVQHSRRRQQNEHLVEDSTPVVVGDDWETVLSSFKLVMELLVKVTTLLLSTNDVHQLATSQLGHSMLNDCNTPCALRHSIYLWVVWGTRPRFMSLAVKSSGFTSHLTHNTSFQSRTSQPISWLSTEKLNLAQQKETKYTTT